MANYRNIQRWRARQERDPEFARRAMYAELLADDVHQDVDIHATINEWMVAWMEQITTTGRGPNGLRGFCSRRIQAIRSAEDA